MSHQFDRVSMAIELETNHFPFDIGYLFGPAPFYQDYPALRFYIHEVLHFWQGLSMGFMANLALGEWQSLLEYEQTGSTTKERDLIHVFTSKDPQWDFSAANLSEALCRYWEVHIINPEQLLDNPKEDEHDRSERMKTLIKRGEQLLEMEPPGSPFSSYPPHIVAQIFDGPSQPYSGMAFDQMIEKLMATNDEYAVPYNILLERCGTNKSVILFPLVGYFALQSRAPVTVFSDVVMQLTEILELNDIGGMDIHETWRNAFPIIQRACQESCLRHTGSLLTPGWDVMANESFKGNAVYSYYSQLLKYLGQGRWFMGEKKQINLDPVFALPGDPVYRNMLAGTFRPPVTIFYDGHWTRETVGQFIGTDFAIDVHDKIIKMAEEEIQAENIPIEKILSSGQLADAALNIHDRFSEMRHNTVVARFKQVSEN